MKIALLLIVLLSILIHLTSCSVSPDKELADFMQDRPIPEIEHYWDVYPQNPCSDGKKIYIDDHYWNTVPEAYKGTILRHEAGHCMGLDHCEQKSCLMYWKLNMEMLKLTTKQLCLACKERF